MIVSGTCVPSDYSWCKHWYINKVFILHVVNDLCYLYT